MIKALKLSRSVDYVVYAVTPEGFQEFAIVNSEPLAISVVNSLLESSVCSTFVVYQGKEFIFSKSK